MKTGTRNKTFAALACLCALAAAPPARAEIGETTGVDEIVNTVGPSWGNDTARMIFSANSWTSYNHNAETQSSVRAVSWSAPSVRLLGAQRVAWDALADSLTQRHRTDMNATGTGAAGRIFINGVNLYECFVLAPVERSECTATRSVTRTMFGDEADFVIGIIPITVSGEIYGTVSGTVRGTSRVRPFATDVSLGAEDTTLGVLSLDSSLVARGFFGFGARDVAYVGIDAQVDLVRVIGAPRAEGSRITCRTGAAGCSRDRRVRYGMTNLLSASQLRTLGGRLRVEACIGFDPVQACYSDTLVSWGGQQLGGAPPIYQASRSEPFSSRY